MQALFRWCLAAAGIVVNIAAVYCFRRHSGGRVRRAFDSAPQDDGEKPRQVVRSRHRLRNAGKKNYDIIMNMTSSCAVCVPILPLNVADAPDGDDAARSPPGCGVHSARGGSGESFFAIFVFHLCSSRSLVLLVQVKKALIASGVSLLFTLIVTVLAFTKMQDMKNGTNKYLIPVGLRSPTPPRPCCCCDISPPDSIY